MPAGTHTLLWSGRSALGPAVPDGVYLIRVEVRGADGGVSRALAAVTIRR